TRTTHDNTSDAIINATDQTAVRRDAVQAYIGAQRTEITEPLRIMEPPSLRCGAAACTVKKTAVMLVLSTDSNVSSDVPPTGVLALMPALAKTMSSLPNFSTACLTAFSVAAISVASATIESAFGPSSFAAASSVA